MAGRKSDFTLPTNTLDELFSTQEERDDAKLNKIRDIPLELIDDFPDHPFKVRDDEDIANAAMLVPALSLSKKKSGSPIARAAAKHIICRFVRLKATFVLIFDKSLGTGTYAK